MVTEVGRMSRRLFHRTQPRPGSPRPAFLFALLGSLGVALGVFQIMESEREPFGLDRVVRPVTQTTVVALFPDAVDTPDARRASAHGVERPGPPVPTRRLGSGTRQAMRLVPAVVRLVSAGRPRRPGVTMSPVVTAMPAPARTTQRPDSARRDDAALGAVQYAKLDQALRRFVDGDSAAPVRVIVQTQPGQHEATARWLTTEGRQVHWIHPAFGGFTATLSASDVAALSGDPSIRRLVMDAVVRATAGPTPAPAAGFVGSKVLDAGETGDTSGVLAATDSAIDHHEPLKIDVMHLSLGHPISAPNGRGDAGGN